MLTAKKTGSKQSISDVRGSGVIADGVRFLAVSDDKPDAGRRAS
ncbi:MAG: hypothetical protein DHS20C08_18770 [Rhodomicrobium sp.]|nr:MAG: hypothetical protein DHS20C08_18770 [Rhodomicrobium sp.]